LKHQDINHIQRLLEFPKKIFATHQRPDVCSAFNESLTIFQRLVDQFWPGPVQIYVRPQSFAPSCLLRKEFQRDFVGFRCASHPLAIKVLTDVYRANESCALVACPVRHDAEQKPILSADQVAKKFIKRPLKSTSYLQILHGEEKKEIFSVPTCQFKDEWLEFWILPEKRVIVIRGKSKQEVLPKLHKLLTHPTKSRILRSLLMHWKIADQRQEK